MLLLETRSPARSFSGEVPIRRRQRKKRRRKRRKRNQKSPNRKGNAQNGTTAVIPLQTQKSNIRWDLICTMRCPIRKLNRLIPFSFWLRMARSSWLCLCECVWTLDTLSLYSCGVDHTFFPAVKIKQATSPHLILSLRVTFQLTNKTKQNKKRSPYWFFRVTPHRVRRRGRRSKAKRGKRRRKKRRTSGRKFRNGTLAPATGINTTWSTWVWFNRTSWFRSIECWVKLTYTCEECYTQKHHVSSLNFGKINEKVKICM